MAENPSFLASTLALALLVPALPVFVLAMLGDAPGEWGQAALAAYAFPLLCVLAAVAFGPWALVAAFAATVALMIGGPWAPLAAGAAAAVLAALLATSGGGAVQPLVCPALAAMGVIAGLRGLM